MAVNDNKAEYMGAVSHIAEQWRARSFEACLNGFMKSMISHCSTVDLPKGVDIGVKEKVLVTVKDTIDASVKEFVSNAVNMQNETGKLFDVDVAHEIENPKDLNESVQKLLAEHIFDESKDRAQVLAAEFDAGTINNLTDIQAVEHIQNMFADEMFDTRFENGASFKNGVKQLLSFEGEIVVDEIKNDVSNLVDETEAKNSIIREAVAEINQKKADIEKQINGASESPTEEPAKEGDHDDPTSDNSNNSDEGEMDDNTTQDVSSEPEEGTEGWYVDAVKKLKSGKRSFTKRSFYSIENTLMFDRIKQSNESLDLDKNSFSREAAVEILSQFRELEDGIDPDNVGEGDNVLSVSENVQKTNDNNPDAESAESTYEDDDDEGIQVDESAFEYKEIEPSKLEGDDDNSDEDDLSEESMAKDFFPLNIQKAITNKIKVNKRFPIFLAFQKDHGEEFFNTCRTRYAILKDMMSREDIQKIDPAYSSDESATKLDKDVALITTIEKDTKTILENFGILGILGNNYQRVDSHVDNALISLFNANVLAPMGRPDAGNNLSVSTEELYEHELADIFKNSVKKAELTMDLASNNVNLNETKDQLGYIDELINEKMFSIVKPEDKPEVEEKVVALYSIECICPIEEVATIKAFVSSKDGTDKPDNQILLNTLKDINGYGFSYIDTLNEIKKNVKAKYEQLKDDKTNFNFNTDTLVDLVAEQQDTTKFEANLFEKTLSKLCENKTIENSTEALILRNKAKSIITSYIVAEKLGFLSQEDINQYNNYLY